MELLGILRVIRKRGWLIVLGTLLILVAVFLISKNMEPVYQAKVTVMVDQSTNAPFPDYTFILTGEDLALTYSELLKSRPILEIVIAHLDLDLSPEDLTEGMLGTNLIPGTQLLELTVEDTDAQRASSIANEIVSAFISLHNTEKQLQSIVSLEQDVVAQMTHLKDLVGYNQSVVDQSRLSPGLMTEEESNLLQSTLSNQQLAYSGLLGTYLSLRLTQAQLLDVSVVEPAIPPTEPIRPNVFVYTFLGVFVGLVFSTGLAFLVEYLDRSFETSDDVSRVLPLPTLGTIPRFHGDDRSSTLVASTAILSPASEAFRTLRTNIRFASVDKPVKTLLVTSAEPGAGKTVVSANLGIVCAQAGFQVVMIDADLRLPSLHQRFDLNNQIGLTDLLVGDVQDVEAVMVGTEIDNLRLIASGPIPPNPSELLSSKMMETVLAEIDRVAELIILDTPPTLVVTDAAVLAPKVDGVILLIEAGQTSHEAARRAWEAHQRVGSTILGAVLTKAKTGRDNYYYYSTRARSAQSPIWRRRLRAPAAIISRILPGKNRQTR
ncbi:MAG: polysaccharide biosynthesis tyrosine autokinase [Anaerolineae bacterium]|nr:MAG: polysaccharide biosynthesis tyrosine autokinase [Anaerolineae bacterium]